MMKLYIYIMKMLQNQCIEFMNFTTCKTKINLHTL